MSLETSTKGSFESSEDSKTKSLKFALNTAGMSISLEHAQAEAVSTPLNVKMTGEARDKIGSAECHLSDLQSSSSFVPEKRVSRQRKPVILMQNQYEEIYATHNNRKQVKNRETTASSTLSSRHGIHNVSPLNRDGDGSTTVEIVSSTTCTPRPQVTKQGNRKKNNLSNASTHTESQTDTVKLDPPVLVSGTKRSFGETIRLCDVNRFGRRKRTREDEPLPVMITGSSSALESHKHNVAVIGSSEASIAQQKHAKNISENSVKFNDASSTSNADDSDDDDSTGGESEDENRECYPKGPIAEGSTTEGTIRVGPAHQATIPDVNNVMKPYTCPRSQQAIQVWKRSALDDNELERFFKFVHEILNEYMDKNGFKSRQLTPIMPQEVLLEPESSNRKSRQSCIITLKECNVDAVLFLLHESSYDVTLAQKVIFESPEKFVTLWNKREEDTFDTGFRKHIGALRQISKAVSETKSHKEVVDFFYRFKIPAQFRRYYEDKMDQARRMLQMVESRRTQETSCDERESFGPVGNILRGDTNGGNCVSNTGNSKKLRSCMSVVAAGELEKRRSEAREFLIMVRGTLGKDKYNSFVLQLKEYKANAIDASHLKVTVSKLFDDQPDLMKGFMTFLPKQLRK